MKLPFRVKFQHWAVATLSLFILTMTAAFMATAFGKFQTMSDQNARDRLGLIAARAADRLKQLVDANGQAVTTLAQSRSDFFVRSGRAIDTGIDILIGALDADVNTYSLYFALPNEDFVQAIGARQEPQVLAALQAPAGTHYALRHIGGGTTSTAAGNGGRVESWTFLDSRRQKIERRSGPASYAPTTRPWFQAAKASAGLTMTPPYLFASTGKLGLTIARALTDQSAVIGADLKLDALQDFLGTLPLSAHGAIVLLDAQNRVLAFHDKAGNPASPTITPLSAIDQTTQPLLAPLVGWPGVGNTAETKTVPVAGEPHVYVKFGFAPIAGTPFQIALMAPVSDFSGPVDQAREQVIQMAVLMLLILLPLALFGSKNVSATLVALAKDSEKIKALDFDDQHPKRESFLYEINALGEAQSVMQQSIRVKTTDLKLAQEKLARLVENGLLLAREQDRTALLRHILEGGRELSGCAAATFFLKTPSGGLRFALRTNADPLPNYEIPLRNPDTGTPNDHFVSVYVANHIESVIIDDVYAETRFDLSGTKKFSEESGFRTVSMLTVPLSPRAGEVLGVLQFLNAVDRHTGQVIPFPRELVGYVEALAAQSAVALENQNLLEAQKELMEALIKLVAGAIDTKSAYTGGHCERVPELGIMLADAAEKADSGPLADFRFNSADERREFRIGAWLHDCGKVTTPEYVVDKATKLETIYNRIHEIRMRFEVLLRDAEIARREAIDGGEAPAVAQARYAERKQQLIDDFAFIAESNVGGEFMAPEKIARLKVLAEQTWTRHFDDRLGLSQDELYRYQDIAPVPTPAIEPLLADRRNHLVPRTRNQTYDPKYGFQLNVPEHLYNFGEIYNLCVARGTLTEEERFKINEHIIQTIIMLDNLPLPNSLKRVPEYAGTHHETLTGTGYPRKLSAGQLSIPARVMAIADIFEALTASDRPYKKGKPLSEAVKILSFFKKDRHIDPDLFDLFLTSGVYLDYAKRYLKPEQIDQVDIAKFVG